MNAEKENEAGDAELWPRQTEQNEQWKPWVCVGPEKREKKKKKPLKKMRTQSKVAPVFKK